MPERSDSTPPSAGTPVCARRLGASIFVGDEHVRSRRYCALKATLDWAGDPGRDETRIGGPPAKMWTGGLGGRGRCNCMRRYWS